MKRAVNEDRYNSSEGMDGHSYSTSDVVALLNNSGHVSVQTYACPLNLQLWWRNPLFYILNLLGIFSGFCFVVHALWFFRIGMLVSACGVILAIWPAIFIFVQYKRRTRFTRWQLGKMGVSTIVFLLLNASITYHEVTTVAIHFYENDQMWDGFPAECRKNPDGRPIINCVRVGNGIPNPLNSTGTVTFGPYKTGLTNGYNTFKSIIMDHVVDFPNCVEIKSNLDTETASMYIHLRCLTAFLGYPDDLAIKFFCNADKELEIWVHSQSRLPYAIWDHNYNDARVRLLYDYIYMDGDHFQNLKRLSDGTSCVATQTKIEL